MIRLVKNIQLREDLTLYDTDLSRSALLENEGDDFKEIIIYKFQEIKEHVKNFAMTKKYSLFKEIPNSEMISDNLITNYISLGKVSEPRNCWRINQRQIKKEANILCIS
jgi:uncharacterized protein YktA (UPF0223 family)